MEVVVKIRTIRPLKNRLLLCELIRSEHAKEVLSDDTPKPRKVEALVERACLQSKAAALFRQLDEFQAKRKNL